MNAFARDGFETCIVRLPEDGRSERRTIELRPQRVTRPFALLLWGARTDSKVHTIVAAGESQLRGAVPGCVFEAEIPFDEFERLLSKRPDDHPALTLIRPIGHFLEIDLPAVELGGSFSVTLEGGYAHGLFIGLMPRYARDDAGDERRVG